MTHPPTRPSAAARPVAGRPPGPDPVRLATLLVRTWLEVRAGRRPLDQLSPLVTPAVQRRLATMIARRRPSAAAGRVHKVRVTRPSRSACEACVTVVDEGGRTTAVAVRLERHLGAWRVTELMTPEAGLPPLSTSSLPDGYQPRDAFDEVHEEEERSGRPRGQQAP
jgi:hypothetical protein